MPQLFEVRPLSEALSFGIEIRGLNPNNLQDPEIQQSLRNHWVQSGVIVFRDLEGEQTHLELSRVFGPLRGHPVQAQDPKRDKVFTVRHNPDDAYLTEVNDVTLGSWLPWHSDLVHVAQINHGGILRPLVLPKNGGETGFLDKVATYVDLPDNIKERIENLYVIYQFDRDPTKQKFGRAEKLRVVREHSEARGWRQKTFPRVLHPMVYSQQETGRKMLNVSPWFALGIHGMPGAESDALLQEVIEHITRSPHTYYHRWQMGDMVLWDNWRVLHCALGVMQDDQRWMERTTIEGDYGMGRLENSEDADTQLQIEV